jgi:hypothetical protein
MSKVAGYKIVLQFDDKTIVGYRKHSMDVDADMADATTGASTGQWKENTPLFKGMEFSIDGLYDPTAGEDMSFDDAYDLLAAGTQFTAKYGNTEDGSTYWSVSAYIKHAHIEGDMNDLGSYTLDVVATGQPTKSTVGE